MGRLQLCLGALGDQRKGHSESSDRKTLRKRPGKSVGEMEEEPAVVEHVSVMADISVGIGETQSRNFQKERTGWLVWCYGLDPCLAPERGDTASEEVQDQMGSHCK